MWKQLLEKTRALDIVKDKKRGVITIRSRDTLGAALQLLASHNILGALVIDSKDDTPLGFVDVLDIAETKQLGVALEDEVQRRKFFDVEIVNLINFSSVDIPIVVSFDTKLTELLDMFCHPNMRHRLHRVAVGDAEGIYQVLTQHDIIRWLQQHLQDIPFASKTVKELVTLRSPVMVRLDDPFSTALEVLYRNRVSGIALVDENGRIAGNLSASDLRGLSPQSFDYFSGSTLQFLVKNSVSPLIPPVTCTEDTTLGEVINTLAQLHIHRIYVVSEKHNIHPIGLIALGDIIEIVRESKNY